MGYEPSFEVTEEQQALRETARRFLTDRSGTDRVRELMDGETGFDPDEWSETAQMGWQAMAVPEEYGGAGYTWHEVGVLMEEMGRSLWCAPFLSSAVLATAALLEAGTDAQRKEHLAALASGERRATVAHRLDAADVEADGGALTGRAGYVLDGHTADLLLIPASDDRLYLVAAEADGVERSPLEVMDPTRKQAELRFDGVAAEPLGTASAGDVIARVRTVGAVMLACEQIGGARRVLEMSTAYARERKQFGRAIGSFQAIKHRLADTLADVENATSAAHHAARALAAGDEDEVRIAAPLAASICGEVYEQAAGDNIQNHGGIGFTWEHDAHLFFKRAKTSKLLFGDPAAWRRELADTLGF